MHEIKTGAPSGKEKVLSFRAALEDPETRVTYIRREQLPFPPWSGLTKDEQTFSNYKD